MLLVVLYGNLNRDAHRKARVAGHGIHGNLPAHAGDDAIDEVEPQTGAFAHAFGGEKRLKNARLNVGRNAGTVVGDLHEDEIVLAGRSDAELAVVAHGIGGVVYQVGPHLVEFAAIGHDLWQVRRVVARHGDAALQLVMHDGQRGFQAFGDVHFLQLGLVHVGIFLDGLDEVRDTGGAVLEFVGDALHLQ